MIDINEELRKIFPQDSRYGLISYSINVEYGQCEFELELYDKELRSTINVTLVEIKNTEDLEEKIKKTLIMS